MTLEERKRLEAAGWVEDYPRGWAFRPPNGGTLLVSASIAMIVQDAIDAAYECGKREGGEHAMKTLAAACGKLGLAKEVHDALVAAATLREAEEE